MITPRRKWGRWLLLVLLPVFSCYAGCDANQEVLAITADEVVIEIDRLRKTVRPMPPHAADAALHALSSGDATMRAQAAISLGKSKHVTQAVSRQLENLAFSDIDPVARGAAITALYEISHPSREIVELTEQLRGDPQLNLLVRSLATPR